MEQTTDTAGEPSGCRCLGCTERELAGLRAASTDHSRSWTRVMHALGLPQEADTDDAVEQVQRLLSELGTAREMRPPTGMWQVSVSVPMSLPREMRDSLFEFIATAAHDWEGWDVDVSGHPTYQPCPDARAHKEASDG
ncbi:hypothetical protein [Amycolatopsis pigmentata]|uniref:Uncharacterized protein n=1 Tax=Amycolatopsis pigmentata TaxID=450801 RepID=A0ABW5G9S0_9PSEU